MSVQQNSSSAFNPSLGSSGLLLERPGGILGLSALPKDTLACRQSEPGFEPPTLQSLVTPPYH